MKQDMCFWERWRQSYPLYGTLMMTFSHQTPQQVPLSMSTSLPLGPFHTVVRPLFKVVIARLKALGRTPLQHPSLAAEVIFFSLYSDCTAEVQAVITSQSGNGKIYRSDPDDMVSMYGKLLEALVQQLERFSPTLLTNPRHASLHAALWACLVNSSVTFSFFWDLCQDADLGVLHRASMRLMLWLLQYVRSDSFHTCVSDIKYHQSFGAADIADSNRYVHTVLLIQLMCLHYITSLPEPTRTVAYLTFPPDYLALLCCILCEVLVHPSNSTFAEVRRLAHAESAAEILSPGLCATIDHHPQLTRSLIDDFRFSIQLGFTIMREEVDLSNPKLLSMFSARSVIHFCKLLIILCGSQHGVTTLPHWEPCCQLLCNILCLVDNTETALPTSHSSSNSSSSSGSGGHSSSSSSSSNVSNSSGSDGSSSLDLSHLLADAHMDHLLLETLCSLSSADPSTMFEVDHLMVEVVSGWEGARQRVTAKEWEEGQADRNASCARITLWGIRHSRVWMCAKQAQLRNVDVPGQVEEQQQQQQHVQACLEDEGAWEVQRVLCAVYIHTIGEHNNCVQIPMHLPQLVSRSNPQA